MAIVGNTVIGAQLCNALGLPKNTRWFELRVGVDELVTIKCEYLPEDLDGALLEPILAEYQLVEKQQKTFAERVAAGEIPAPPPPPLSRAVREDVHPFHACPRCHSSMARKWWVFGRRKCIHPECGYVDGDLDGRNGNGYQPLHERYPNRPNVNPPPTCAKPPAPPNPPPAPSQLPAGAHIEPLYPWPR